MKKREGERERRLCWEIAGPEFKKVDFYLTRVYIGQLLVNRSLYIIHVMRNHSSLNFNQKEELFNWRRCKSVYFRNGLIIKIVV